MARARVEGKKWLLPIVCVLLGWMLAFQVREDQASGSQRSPYAAFPLWKDVSGSGPFATLREGQLPNGTRWGAYVSRVGKGRLGYERPCLSMARITRIGLYTDVHGCAPVLSIEDEASSYVPNYLSISATYQTRPDGPFIGETVLGLTFNRSVRSVVLKYADGGQMRQQTRLFNARQQDKTKLPPFRYVAIALQKDVCVATVIGYGNSGAELFSAETVLCSDDFGG